MGVAKEAGTKKLFLAGPFKSLVDVETGCMQENEQRKLMQLISFFEARNYDVHNAHKREGWGKDFMTPDQCTAIDFEEIRACDQFVAFPGCPASPGTHIEIGWASAFGKPIILLLEEGKEYAFLIRGLGQVADVTYIYYREEQDYLSELERMFAIS
ncbi:nucleoside 2-deoxyribosyltransferase [Paenibacillus thiaminolyticus]|uniref:nucleoside 2-deoxyribosyltransferase n=1 Tax=Paenibacillus thiaminolyticus TaxID=49283 RepID=UPI00233076F3|nr:nucleoside 2-deoxyribosyltransferase [Paenibacillus thiaminolyticus]WCF07886.1 nucleoside 2-deoxyribosyltransferase [Paenibacillus thiaminolyticus]